MSTDICMQQKNNNANEGTKMQTTQMNKACALRCSDNQACLVLQIYRVQIPL